MGNQLKKSLHICFAVGGLGKVININSRFSSNWDDILVSLLNRHVAEVIAINERREKPHMGKHKKIMNDWNDTSCTLTSLPAWDLRNFKHLIFCCTVFLGSWSKVQHTMMAQGTARDRKRDHNTKFHSYFRLSGKLFIYHEKA
jgi:hypothetical protein